jgi:excisionase family DNA binding protein
MARRTEWITVPEAARLRQRAEPTIRQWIKLGYIRAEKWGRDWRVDRASLMAHEPQPEGWPAGRPRTKE